MKKDFNCQLKGYQLEIMSKYFLLFEFEKVCTFNK